MYKYMEIFLASKLQFKSTLNRQQRVVLDSIIYSTNTTDVMNHYLLIGHINIFMFPDRKLGSGGKLEKVALLLLRQQVVIWKLYQ